MSTIEMLRRMKSTVLRDASDLRWPFPFARERNSQRHRLTVISGSP
jgi:hypothetical protein